MNHSEASLDALIEQWCATTVLEGSRIEAVRAHVLAAAEPESPSVEWWIARFSGLKAIMRAGLPPAAA